MKRTFCIWRFFCLSLWGQAQIPLPEPLQPGDSIPDYSFTSLLHHPSGSLRLSDYPGELLILDFWASWCGTCANKFPLLDSMEKEYAGRLKVILVNSVHTRDTELKLEKFFARRRAPDGSHWQFPVILYDSLLFSLFPHRILPHYVWIYRGRYYAATGSAALNSCSIRAVLSGWNPCLPQKNDPPFSWEENHSNPSN